jgi:hypothetical protein
LCCLAAAEAIADSEAAHEAVLKNFDPDTAGYYAMEIGFATLRLEQRLMSEKMDAFHVIISALALIASPRQLGLAVSAASTINNNELVVLRRVCHALIGTTDYQELEQVSDVEMTEDGARKNWAFGRKEWALNSVALALAKVGQHARARQVAAGIEDLGIRADALCGLAAILARAGEFALALEILETVEDTEAGMSWSKKAAIVILTRLAGQDWASRLLAVAESITNDDARAQALVAVALVFADSGDREGLRRVVNDVQVIEYEHLRAEALGAVAQALARAGDLEMLRHCLLAVRGIVEPWSRVVYLVGVCLGLGRMEDLDGLNRALTLAVEIDEQARSTALRGIARAMAQAGDKAGIKRVFAATQAIQDERERAIVLGGPRLVLTYQDTDLIHEMYVSDQARVGVASALAELGDFDCIQQAFDFVSSMEDTDSRTEGLTGVIIAMAKTGNSDLLSRALALIESEGLSEGFISSMTEAMASRRDANGLQRILTVAEETEDPYLRAQALTCLAKAYSALSDVQGLEKTLSLAEAYTYEAAKADAVAGVALALAQGKDKDVVRLRRVLAAAASVSYEPPRSEALCNVANAAALAGEQQLAAEAAQRAITVAKEYNGEGIEQAQVSAVRILSRTPDKKMLGLALSMANVITRANEKRDALTIVADAMDQVGDRDGLKELLLFTERIPEEWVYVNVLRSVAAALDRIGEGDLALSAWARAFARIKLADRPQVFDALGQGASLIAAVDRGQTLWSTYEGVTEVEAWWGT